MILPVLQLSGSPYLILRQNGQTILVPAWAERPEVLMFVWRKIEASPGM